MLGPTELAIVVRLVKEFEPRVAIEFGTNLGNTARAILDATPSLETYIGIDLPDGCRPRLRGQHHEIPLYPGLNAAADPRFKLLLRDSMTLEAHDLEPIDAAFIDGDHSALAVEHDSRLAAELLRPGGIIIWHDVGNPTVEVTGVIDRLINENWPICHVPNTWLAFMRV
jgi:predicted O-methyltransferase YrrM